MVSDAAMEQHAKGQTAPGGCRMGSASNSAMSAPGFEHMTKPIWPHGYVGMQVYAYDTRPPSNTCQALVHEPSKG